MTRYIPLNSVLNFIPKGVRDEEKDDTQLLSWALQGLRTLNISQRFEQNVCILEVKNHRVQLPDSIRKINSIHHLHREPTEEEANNFECCINQDVLCGCDISDLEPNDDPTSTENICRLPVYYQLFIDSNYFQNCWSYMKYTGVRKGLHCPSCPNLFCNSCVETYAIDTNLNMMTSFKDGFVCVDYVAEPKDTAGNFLIPEDTDLQQGLSYYIQAMHWNNRASRKEQGAFQYYIQYLNLGERLLTKAKGKHLLKAIDKDLIYIITNNSHRLLRTPKVWAQRFHSINDNN
jgi:hypothetical protein